MRLIQTSHLARGLRPKRVDVDKPIGFVKRHLRRWWRTQIKRWTVEEAKIV